MRWARWHEDVENRRVAYTELEKGWVSTVFLGIDHRFGGHGPPLLFETASFPQANFEDTEMIRTSTWEDALRTHKKVVNRITKLLRLVEDLK